MLQKHIREVPNFPKEGILFRDITPLLANPQAFNLSLSLFEVAAANYKVDVVAGIESRGFIFGAALAARLHKAFVPIRKPGKLPAETDRVAYNLEYGSDAVEIHKDAVGLKDSVLLIDDVLATGGTAKASIELIEKQKASVCAAFFLIELESLNGAKNLQGTPQFSLLTY
ncbi:MAG: adenine phosphoribosyltransferase [Myxococcales bacterium]|nr:MAG: adenine phosphoribosyltransferase [Myxococcales bacterium]